jgi:hypothetical protein
MDFIPADILDQAPDPWQGCDYIQFGQGRAGPGQKTDEGQKAFPDHLESSFSIRMGSVRPDGQDELQKDFLIFPTRV